MRALVWTANLLGWPLIHLGIASVALRIPDGYFARDSWITTPRRWEAGGRVYRDWLAVRSWKAMLPDGAPWLGGAAKTRLHGRDRYSLAQYALETRRAEVAHWAMLCCAPIFFCWNPPWACLLMTAYALAANLPCIVAQRYNRLVLDRVLEPRTHERIRR